MGETGCNLNKLFGFATGFSAKNIPAAGIGKNPGKRQKALISANRHLVYEK
jgi:hypothetical protein